MVPTTFKVALGLLVPIPIRLSFLTNKILSLLLLVICNALAVLSVVLPLISSLDTGFIAPPTLTRLFPVTKNTPLVVTLLSKASTRNAPCFNPLMFTLFTTCKSALGL